MTDDRSLEDLARRHGVSLDAVRCLAQALQRGQGRMAQFQHPELGGSGQWMPGMTMVGNMFDHAARARVEAICAELSARQQQAGGWWPPHVGGRPTSEGWSNDVRFAWFRESRRLVVQDAGRTVVYDTLDHDLRSASCQSAGGHTRLLLVSQRGPVDLSDLPVVG